jgi:DNA (cytosine-5)-methyltransferase 1
MTVIWQSEIDPYCCRVLAKHWPDTPNLGDVRDIDWQRVERPDVICGGYPCQPFSLAGKRQGVEDPRHLWPQYADAIRTLRPRYAVLENVYGHLSKGFGEVVAELSSCGYDVEWDCVPAAAVGAPHLRDRLFAIATPAGDVADANSTLGNATGATSKTLFRPEALERFRRRGRSNGGGHDWAVEPDVGRVAHGIPARVDRLRALGNAVVPQVAQYIGELITAYHEGANE